MIMAEKANYEQTDGKYLLNELEAIVKAERNEIERENLDIDFDVLFSLVDSPDLTRLELEQAKRHLTQAWGFNRKYTFDEQSQERDSKYRNLIFYLSKKLGEKN